MTRQKILWAANAPYFPSGYGVQSALFGPRLRDLGHEVAFYATYGAPTTLEWEQMTVYPEDGCYGNVTLAECARRHAGSLADCLVIALGDAWQIDPAGFPEDLRLALWAPVDHEPMSERTRAVLANHRVTPIAMSRFGENEMRLAGLDPLYVPHAVDTTVFRPRPDERAEIRAAIGVPEDAFLVGMVAANTGSPLLSRKGFPQLFRAFARFQAMRPDALLYVHTNGSGDGSAQGGLDLSRLAASCGIESTSVRLTDPVVWALGVSREDLARLVCVFDVLVMPSLGEGFGVPLIEAQACGVPVIATNHSSMRELCEAGWLVDGEPWYDGPHDSWFRAPSVKLLTAALDIAYQSRDDQEIREEARAFALRYDVDHVVSAYWEPALEALSSDRVREVEPLVAA